MIILDFETYSPIPITSGAVKYVTHPDADIIFFAYKVRDEGPTKIWYPGQALPELFESYEHDLHDVYAHNALFDYLVWHVIGSRKYGLPIIPLPKWKDTMALAMRYTLPGSLEKAGEVLNLGIQKSRRGKQLIKKICVPTVDGRRPTLAAGDFTQTDLLDFVEYGIQDVDSTEDLINSLPSDSLTEQEQGYWVLTQRMNLEGLPIDVEAADKILSYIESYVEEMTLRVPELTDGMVQKVTQVAKVREWMATKGVEVDNLQAATVEALLEADIPEDVHTMLILRQALGRSSTAKYRKIIDMAYEGRVFNNVLYYGAGTGRWAGRGFQMHNLPRASVPNPEEVIEQFKNFEPVLDPVNVAKALIRPMIYSGPDTSLIVSDYKAIENRLLAWVAGEEVALQGFRNKEDQYVDMAAYMYGATNERVTKLQRQVGKIVVLGCGFQMGADRLQDTATSWGVSLSKSECIEAVNAFRSKYKKIKKLWKRLFTCCVEAIRNPGMVYTYNNCRFRVVKCRAGNRWLVLTLPSGRNLFYMEPFLGHDEYGAVPRHYGINPYSKKWSRLTLIPGRITENIIQALARDIMANGLTQVATFMPEVTLLGTVHDEGIGEIADQDITDRTISRYDNLLCDLPDWAEGLPLEAEGYIAKRYRK